MMTNADERGGARGKKIREKERKSDKTRWKEERRRAKERKRQSEYARYSARLGAALANFFVVDDCSDAKSLQVLPTSIFDPLLFLLFTYILFLRYIFPRVYLN